LQEAALCVAEIGHGVERHVWHGFAKDGMEGDQVVKGAGGQAAILGEHV